MSLGRGSRGWVAAGLLAAACLWSAARLAAFEIRAQADAAFWDGQFPEALRKYRWLENFGPSRMKARSSELRAYLSLMEIAGEKGTAPSPGGQESVDGISALIQGQVEEEALSFETWSGLAEVYAALKPGNQAHRVYRLEEITRPPEEGLELEDLLAIRAWEVSLDLDPNGVYQRDSLGDLAWGLGLKELAKKHYGDVMAILPNQEKHPFLAQGKVSEELQEVVVNALKRSVKPPLNADPTAIFRHLGMFLMDQGRYQEAFDAFQSAQEASGLSSASWKALAKTGMGQWEDAIALYREARSSGNLPPDDLYYVLNSLGDLLERQGRHREAAEAFESALLLRPRDPVTLGRLAQVDEAMGLLEDAEELYIRASEIGPDRMTALAQLVAFYRRIGKPESALLAAGKLLELQPGEALYQKQVQELKADIEKGAR